MKRISRSSPSTLLCVSWRYRDALVELAGQPLVDAFELFELGVGHELAVLPLVVHQLLDRSDLLEQAYLFAQAVVVLEVFFLHLAQPLFEAVQPEVFGFELGGARDGEHVVLLSRGYALDRAELLRDLGDPVDLVAASHKV